jgi:hypothetical protein
MSVPSAPNSGASEPRMIVSVIDVAPWQVCASNDSQSCLTVK